MPKLVIVSIVALCAGLSITRPIGAQMDVEFNTAMMDATVQIWGPSDNAGKTFCGSAFFIGASTSESPEAAQYTLVTAAHVLAGIAGDDAHIAVRVKRDDQIVRTEAKVPIRKLGASLFVRHPTADVAVVRVTLPKNNAHAMVNWPALATDDVFAKLDIHPGDEMLTIGYPLCAAANRQGYPMLRRGAVASPIHVPGIVLTEFLLDAPTFQGNSGGPVYFEYADRMIRGVSNKGETHRYVAGLVSQQRHIGDTDLFMATVVPAQFIAEALKRLPQSAQHDRPSAFAGTPTFESTRLQRK